jgi:hypothetical protein
MTSVLKQDTPYDFFFFISIIAKSIVQSTAEEYRLQKYTLPNVHKRIATEAAKSGT